ncbi:MAG: hypothetical protein M1819_002982 [Sarea resinae]|nr:MAG: hypothetical protein M1819_002982 [Sarea resinae]
MDDRILSGLNAAQRHAVASPAAVLQILAPPGSGKTKTLTSRVAYLLSHHGLDPCNVIVATFTVKAAREMRDRIKNLIGEGLEKKLVLGTFHSIALRYLFRYGSLIGVKSGFSIADSSDSLGIIKRIVKRRGLQLRPEKARARISTVKAKGGDRSQAVVSHPRGDHVSCNPNLIDQQEFDTVYDEYETVLADSNLLDYDDLLLRCVQLLQQHPACVSNVQAVLIDEYQDTNVVQFELMRLFAQYKETVTIVGDPDQSIYGFRSAEIKNLDRMREQYPQTLQILLEENYRSSGSILLAALEVIQQDTSRPPKTLLPTHSVGTRPVLRRLECAADEAQWIVSEIRRALGLAGNLLINSDFAILVRSAFLSRNIESALGQAGLPYRMVGGSRFFDRLEIKILIDYLRVISQPGNSDALARIINVPPRRIGEKTVKGLLEEAETRRVTLWSLIQSAPQEHKPTTVKLSKPALNSLGSFVNLIQRSRKRLLGHSNSACSFLDLVESLIDQLSFEQYLEKTHPNDHETRWANVQELVAQATEVSQSVTIDNQDEDDFLPQIDGLEQHKPSSTEDVLSNFLANVTLTSEVKPEEDGNAQDHQITISTIHAAKGLEWPVVFIPGAYEGSIPHSRAENTDEERRLLYVAMTRAQALLYMSSPAKSSQNIETSVSHFLSQPSLVHMLEKRGPLFRFSEIQSIARILRRQCPSESDIAASCGVKNVEDDLWPTDRDTDGEQSEDSTSWSLQRGHRYQPSLHPAAKRRRIDAEWPINPHGAAQAFKPSGLPSTETTMQNPQAFSVSNTSLSNGFMSASAHLQQLGSQGASGNAIPAGKTKLNKTKNDLGSAKHNGSQSQPEPSKLGVKTKVPGQGSLLDFFKENEIEDPASPRDVPTGSDKRSPLLSLPRPRNGAGCSRPHKPMEVISINEVSKPEAREGQTMYHPFQSHGGFSLPTVPDAPLPPTIPPPLAGHRLKPRPFKGRPPSIRDDSHEAKNYVFLSSSPPPIVAPQPCVAPGEIEATKKSSKDTPRDTLVETMNMNRDPPTFPRPAATTQPANMSHLPDKPDPQNKTLGIRRGMNGWANRGRFSIPRQPQIQKD